MRHTQPGMGMTQPPQYNPLKGMTRSPPTIVIDKMTEEHTYQPKCNPPSFFGSGVLSGALSGGQIGGTNGLNTV